jgi:signal transduction histidine kinase
LRTIDQAADRLAEVIRGLLLPGQTEPRHVRCRCAPTDLPDLLDRIASELHDDMPDAPIKFRCQPVASRVTIDRSLITRVIKHLIDCSLETSAQEGIIHVEVWIGDDGPLITIARDASCQKDQWTESLPLPKWNNDLRVVACRNILKAHGSTLHIETMPDHSVRFWFTLPQAATQNQGN